MSQWLNLRNWCAGKDLTARGLRDTASTPNGMGSNYQCVEDVITDPCTGKLVQYPVGFDATTYTNSYQEGWQEVRVVESSGKRGGV